MPKELTHLIVAEKAWKTFSESQPDSTLGKVLERHADHYRFGAVMHDVSFCGSSSAMGNVLKEKGMAVHGNPPNDTIAPFKNLAEAYDRTGNPEILALMAGGVSHMIADYVFHPFVYYFTGDDIARHYRLETLIDTHLYHKQDHRPERCVSTLGLYKNLKASLEGLADHLLVFLDLSEAFKPELIKALKLHAFTIKLFRSRMGYHLFRMASAMGSSDTQNKARLFYPPGMRFDTSFLDSDIDYRHPVTGEHAKGSPELLAEAASKKTSGMLEKLGKAADGQGLAPFFSTIPPVSFETGLPPSMGRTFIFTDLSRSIDGLVSNKQP